MASPSDHPDTIVTVDTVALAGDALGVERSAASRPPVVPGYDLVRVIGRGGMGVVWEAVEHRLERRVALKVHADALSPERAAAMWSEARLAAKVADPGVVAVHDLGRTLDGGPYYTMDLVEGTDLRALVREGPMPLSRALPLAADIARAVGAAHDRGIVHCDLKPANILVDVQGRARILDFGLAYGEGSLLQEGEVRGTPGYMAPEQVEGKSPTAATDVHAIGLLLYEMLTGKGPHHAKDAQSMMQAALETEPAPPSALNPGVSAEVDEVCLRCLAKDPRERFPNAGTLAASLGALADGRPLEDHATLRFRASSRRPAALHVPRSEDAPVASKPPPVTEVAPSPVRRDRASLMYRWAWKLRSAPDVLWPHVANTDRVNKAAGMPAVAYTDRPGANGGSVRTGTFRVFGMQIAWREYPYDWVQGRELAVHRRYTKGLVDALWFSVRLMPSGEGGTELVCEMWLMPRGFLGRLATAFHVGFRLRRGLDRVFRELDARVADRKDPFEARYQPTPEQRAHAEASALELVERRHFDRDVVDRLVDHLLHAPAKSLERLRPFALADAWGTDREATLEMFLHAANAGLVDLSWDVVCPRCMIPHESHSELGGVASAGVCVPCCATYDRDLARSVELVFVPHAGVRRVVRATYCAGAPALRPHVVVQQNLAPGEQRRISTRLARGDYRITAPGVETGGDFVASHSGYLDSCDVDVSARGIDVRPSVVRAGEVSFTFTNRSEREHTLRVEVPGLREDAVSAAAALTHPIFRDFFSHELLAEEEPMRVGRLGFLFVDVPIPELLEARGDAGALEHMRKLDALLDTHGRVHRGTVAPSQFGPYTIAFDTSEAAVGAALAILVAARGLGLTVKASVHEGPCIALSRRARVDYFGKTLHRGACLLEDAPQGGLVMSEPVASRRAVAETLLAQGATSTVLVTTVPPYRGLRATSAIPRG